jgi:hypothetical protein
MSPRKMANKFIYVVAVAATIHVAASYVKTFDTPSAYVDRNISVVADHYAETFSTNRASDLSVLTLRDFGHVEATRQMFRDSLRRVSADLDFDSGSAAARAIVDAMSLLQDVAFKHEPWASVTDDGIAMLKWQPNDDGILLLFSGDGVVSASTSSETQNYSEASNDYRIGAPAAALISNIIKKLYS